MERFGTKTKEIKEWTEHNVLAEQNYRCDQCGHTIHAHTRYNRRVLREEHKNKFKRFILVWREHAGDGCPEVCSGPYKW